VSDAGLAEALVDLLARGALTPECSYSRRQIKAALAVHRPASAAADVDAIVAAAADDAATSGATIPGVAISRCGAKGRRFALALGEGTRGQVTIYRGDNLAILEELADASVDLIYIDPPFNTGIKQARTRFRTDRDEDGDRVGFRGERYRSVRLGTRSFADAFDDYLGFLAPRLEEAHRLLRPGGSLFLHLDYREVHYAKVLLDQIFGRDAFLNEIIWAYDYGGRTTKRWPAKHDNILWYARDPQRYCFDYDAVDRIPYMAPGLVGAEKAARGKTPTDTWWHTIVSPSGREKTGYPTQKPLGILNRIIRVHSRRGDTILDFFAGSGSIGEAAALHGRHAILIDQNPEAIAVMRGRLARFSPRIHDGVRADPERRAGVDDAETDAGAAMRGAAERPVGSGDGEAAERPQVTCAGERAPDRSAGGSPATTGASAAPQASASESESEARASAGESESEAPSASAGESESEAPSAGAGATEASFAGDSSAAAHPVGAGEVAPASGDRAGERTAAGERGSRRSAAGQKNGPP
jgi:site-specific DNA-methyltransferase (adenine-specific)